MNRLPSTWAEATIGSVCVETEQVTPESEVEFTYVDIGSVDRLQKKVTAPQRLRGRDAPSRARKLLRTGDTIVSTTRPNLNAVALVDHSLDGQIASTGFEVLRAPGLDARWLGYLVRTSAFVDAMASLVQGALYPAVRGKDVRSFVAPIAPANEQKRIADKLDTVLARVDAVTTSLTRVSPILKRFRQSVLAAATSGRLTEDWRTVRGVKAASDAVEETPFSARQMTHLLSKGRTPLKTGPFGTLLSKSEHVAEGIEVVGIENIDQGKFRAGSRVRVTPEKASELSAYDLQPGDVIISRSGTVGEVCVVPASLGELRFSTNIIRVVLDKEIIKPDYFVFLFLGCTQVLRQVGDLCKGSTRLFLNQTILNAISYPVPGLEEQAEIIRRVDTLFAFADRLETRLQSARTATERLTPALLTKAFRGELVPQDPNDEPASELLRRLQQEASSTATRRGRKSSA